MRIWKNKAVPLSMFPLYCSRIPREFTVVSLVLTWSPRFEPYLDEGQWPTYTGPKYIADPGACWKKPGTRKRMRYKMVMD
jgi:hypothetical protein